MLEQSRLGGWGLRRGDGSVQVRNIANHTIGIVQLTNLGANVTLVDMGKNMPGEASNSPCRGSLRWRGTTKTGIADLQMRNGTVAPGLACRSELLLASACAWHRGSGPPWSRLPPRPSFCCGAAAGGRMSTRFTSGGHQYDHGCQFFKATSPAMKKLVAEWVAAGEASGAAGLAVKAGFNWTRKGGFRVPQGSTCPVSCSCAQPGSSRCPCVGWGLLGRVQSSLWQAFTSHSGRVGLRRRSCRCGGRVASQAGCV